MRVRYYTNRTGPVSRTWYEERGLTTENVITKRYSSGRIDVTGDPTKKRTIPLPPMADASWKEFSDWITDIETDSILTLDDLVEKYETNHSHIDWWTDKS